MNKDLDEAESLVRRAMKLKPDDGYITDSLGWVLFRQGNYKEAIATLENAYRLKPDEAIIAEHLGDAYRMYALRDKARQMYLRAVGLEKDDTNVAKIKQKLMDLEREMQAGEPSARVPASVR